MSPPWKERRDAKFMMLPRRWDGEGVVWESMCAPMSRQSVKTELRFTWMTYHVSIRFEVLVIVREHTSFQSLSGN